jgi:hypothetical protein
MRLDEVYGEAQILACDVASCALLLSWSFVCRSAFCSRNWFLAYLQLSW